MVQITIMSRFSLVQNTLFKYNYRITEGAIMFPTTTVGRKILMTLTGQFILFYVVAHLLGNLAIYSADAINAYADSLRHWPFIIVLWSSRFFLFVSIVLHACYGVILWLENRRSKPHGYAISTHLSATFAGRNMLWTGVIVGSFLVYHVLHFTFQIIEPSTSAIGHPDALGRPDVFMMVAQNFRGFGIASIYIAGTASLLLHLMHGIQSSLQTWGLNNDRTLPVFVKTGLAASAVLFLGYAAIPISILMGLLK